MELDHAAIYDLVCDTLKALRPDLTVIPSGDDGQQFEVGIRPALPFATLKVLTAEPVGLTADGEYVDGAIQYRRKVSASLSVQWFGPGGVSALSSLMRRMESPDHADLDVLETQHLECLRALRRPQNMTIGLEGAYEPRAGMDFSISFWETWEAPADPIEQVSITYDYDDVSETFVGG